jgi:hypothetical protein
VASWKPGETVNIEWEVVAGDGAGTVTASIDYNGGTAFDTTMTLVGTNPTTAVGKYSFTATVPTGKNCSRCTVQLASSGWVACTTVAIGTAAPPPQPTRCITTPALSFCNSVSNKANVALPGNFANASAFDDLIAATYHANLANVNVFATPDTPGCRDAYKKLICGLQWVDCTSFKKPGCNQACQDTVRLCGLTELHKTYYDCSTIPNTNADMTGSCNFASKTQVSALVLALTALLAFFLL